MNDKKTTSRLVDELIDLGPTIEAVDTPPFFKDKVLNRLSDEGTERTETTNPNWLSPKFQLVALLIFVLLNLAVLYHYNSSNQEQELQSFADAYGLSSSQGNSILN